MMQGPGRLVMSAYVRNVKYILSQIFETFTTYWQAHKAIKGIEIKANSFYFYTICEFVFYLIIKNSKKVTFYSHFTDEK